MISASNSLSDKAFQSEQFQAGHLLTRLVPEGNVSPRQGQNYALNEYSSPHRRKL